MTQIIVIDDDRAILENVIEWLIHEGFDAIGAEDGREGTQLTLQLLPDLVISDINMPGWDGYRVLLELRSHPETSLIPIIFLSAKVTQREIRYGMELGADDYLTKPFSPTELISAIRTRLNRAEQARQRTLAFATQLHHELVYMLPHELRTPLVTILGFSELLAINPAALNAQEITDIAQNILSSGYRLQNLIENFLLYVQLDQHTTNSEGNKLAEIGSLYAPDYLIARLANQIAETRNRHNDLHLDLSANLPLRIAEADLNKIVSELIKNAFEFSKPDTSVVITSRINSPCYELTIADRGRGMKPDEVKRIGALIQFNRAIYEQQGSGLGLILAKRLVDLYNGVFTLNSQIGIGTTITIQIPLLQPL